jgi:HEAT repeat protein
MSRSKMRFGLLAGTPLAGASLALGQVVPAPGPEQVSKLIAVLKSDAPHKEKADACRQLGVVGTKDAVPALAALLPDEKLSHMARYGLEPNPDPSVDDALRDALGKLKGRPLVGVIASVGVRRDAKAVGLLSRYLEETDTDLVRTTARSLGKIATPEAAKALQQRMASAPAPLRRFVADGCLTCAEGLLALGKKADAAAMYESVERAELSDEYIRAAAKHGATLAR